jgi:hypothetical protein
MIKVTTIIFCFINFIAVGQTCDTINGRLINCVDSSGRKQGKWETLKTRAILRSHSGYGTENGCQYIDNSVRQPIEAGQYKDNKKIGTWEYIEWEGFDYSHVAKTVTYHHNGSLTERNFLYNSVIEFNRDSSFITGFTIHKSDSIYVTCTNKTCVFALKANKKIISFDYTGYERLDYELSRLSLGVYNREIMNIKIIR